MIFIVTAQTLLCVLASQTSQNKLRTQLANLSIESISLLALTYSILVSYGVCIRITFYTFVCCWASQTIIWAFWAFTLILEVSLYALALAVNELPLLRNVAYFAFILEVACIAAWHSIRAEKTIQVSSLIIWVFARASIAINAKLTAYGARFTGIARR